MTSSGCCCGAEAEPEPGPDEVVVCDKCTCTEPCNPACEDAKTAQESKDNSKCSNASCPGKKKDLPVTDSCPDLELGAESKSETKRVSICETCKCSVGCNPDCEHAQNMQNKSKSTIQSESSKVSVPETIPEGKESPIPMPKICVICRCSGECNPQCQANKIKKNSCNSKTCSQQASKNFSRSSSLIPVSTSKLSSTKAKKVCNDCKCAPGQCPPACEELKPSTSGSTAGSVAASVEICETCACTGKCLPQCEEKKLALRGASNKSCTCTENSVASVQCNLTPSVKSASTINSSVQTTCDCGTQASSKSAISVEAQEIQSALKSISCSCDAAASLAPIASTIPPTREPSALPPPPPNKQLRRKGSTPSDLRMAICMLKQKCTTKDVMIDAMIGELNARAGSCIFNSLLKKIACNREEVADFDRTLLTQILLSPKIEQKRGQNLNKFLEKCICGKSVDPSPLSIVLVKKIGPTSMLIRWNCSKDQSVTGYEICVNDVVKANIQSASRNNTVIDSLDLKDYIKIDIFAVSVEGRCMPPATFSYDSCSCP